MTGGNQMTITEIVAIIALVFQGFLVWLAYSAIKRNELTAKKRAIVDHIIKQREDKVLAEVFQELYRLRDEKQRQTLYQDLELLANRWSANPIKELKKSTYRDR